MRSAAPASASKCALRPGSERHELRRKAPHAVRLTRAFYARPTLDVARELIGKVLVHERAGRLTSGIIVETEAYIGESDPACHAAPGPTVRNAPLYGPPGFAYVYLNYGIHYLLNAVTEPEGSPAAVLIGALEPLEGQPVMLRRRQVAQSRSASSLCRCPCNLPRALGISLKHNRSDLTRSALRIEDRGLIRREVLWGPRVGINVGVERAWRCYAAGSEAVSLFKAGTKKTRRRSQPSA